MTDQFEKGYALLIGVDENHVPAWALPGVARDIAALSRVLTHPERCAYPGDNIRVLTGQAATRQAILDGLEWLQERVQTSAGGDATLFIYYSGHGWRDQAAEPPDFYLIPCDVRQDQVRARALRAADFAEAVAGLQPGRLLVVMDCCHAAGMGVKDVSPLASGYVGTAIPPALLMAGEKEAAGPGAKSLEALAQGKGRAVLSSSSGTQRSYMRRDGQMSIFTYHLIEALTGHAQPGEGATEVLVSDVMSHVWRHVPRSAQADWGVDQTPDYQVSGNFPIALLLGGQPWSKGQAAPDPLGGISTAEARQGVHQVNTGGGAFIGGSVKVEGGDFVSRDQVIYGDKVRGDKVGGDKISFGDVSGSAAIAAGRGAQQRLGGDELAQLFANVYGRIEARPEDPDVDKEELIETVQKIETEVAKGEAANPKRVERWLKILGAMADDILDVTVACLTNPAAGIAAVVRKVAEKARQEGSQA